MISIQDDHFCFITSSVKIWSPTEEKALKLLKKMVKCNGVPEQILPDQGTQFKPARDEICRFAIHCNELGIKHITASKCKPITIGKIEAFHQPYETELHCSSCTIASYAATTTQDRMRH